MDRAYDGAAYAFGGTIEREPLQGYMPILHRGADKVMEESVKLLELRTGAQSRQILTTPVPT